MEIILHALPALNGDCLLVSFGGRARNHILIDCGYGVTYKNYLQKLLHQIAAKGECLERLIITHIDSDHILGAIPFLKDNELRFIEVKDVWHNTLRHLTTTHVENHEKVNDRLLKRIAERGYYEDKVITSETMISAEQGTTVGALLLQGKYSWNADFDHQAVCIENKRRVIVDDNLAIFLLSPDRMKLKALERLWTDELAKHGIMSSYTPDEVYDDAFEMLMSWEIEVIAKQAEEIASGALTVEGLLGKPLNEDKTATNGSSIALVLEIGAKKLLLLADAHPDIILKSLNEYQFEGLIQFDLIKVAHHGSSLNISKELLAKIDSERYLVSTNGGRHGHPDLSTIAHIISRPSKFHRSLYFNYQTKSSDYFDNIDLKNRFNYSIHYIDQEPFSISL